MNNLIPERRMNKNGIMTTKWVLPPSDGGTGRGSIPSPVVLPKSPKVYSPKYGVEVDVADTDFARAFGQSMMKHSNLLGEIDPHVVQTLEYMIQESEDNDCASLADSATRMALNIVSSSITRGESVDFTALNNLAVFGGAVMQRESRSYEVQSLVMGLGQGDRDFLLDATEEEREVAITLVTAASRLKPPFVKIEGDGYYSDNRTVQIASGELADFFLSRPDDVDRIAQVVNERDTDNVDVIRDILDHEQQSLREGVL
jgi:hypothetical protein